MGCPTTVETLEGLVERITFHNQDTGFFIIKVKAPHYRDVVTIIGAAQRVCVGEHFEAEGSWVVDRKYGQQFKAHSIVFHPPNNEAGIINYLGSGLIKGIGPVYAKRLVAAFGTNIFNVIEHQPEKIRALQGIGSKRAEIIITEWHSQKQVKEIMVFLHSYEISTSRAAAIYKAYGNKSIDVLRSNPYQISEDIKGIGFFSADKIALSMGIETESSERIVAALIHILVSAMDQGYCGLESEELISKATAVLSIDQSLVEAELALQFHKEKVIQHICQHTQRTLFYMPVVYHTERKIAHNLKQLILAPNPINIEAEKAVEWVQKKIDFELSPSQKKGLQKALNTKVCIITGGPGVGKTTLVNCLIKILFVKVQLINLTAPTGRAAKKMFESTGVEASTLHKTLAFSPQTGRFRFNAENPLKGDVFIVDESSMIDIFLFNSFINALPIESRVIFLGDIDQLPSVGPGQVLRDMIESESLPVIRLTEIFRQGKGSLIISNANRINQGMMPLKPEAGNGNEFSYISVKNPDEGLRLLLQYMHPAANTKRQHPQILTPMKAGILGTRNMNAELQKLLNPNTGPYLTIFGQKYLVGDSVMQIRNNYDKDVYNGDLGTIKHIDSVDKQVTLEFDGRQIPYELDEMDQVDLSYAMTIHKSQGSEFPVVIVPIFMSHFKLLMRNLLYTAVTRGKHKVILIGESKAIALAIKNDSYLKRNSLLGHWLEVS